jgi:hypothetical protein
MYEMISFDIVSKNSQLVEFVKIFVDYLRQKIRPAYLFGSATWRLVLGEFDETKNDLDFLLYNGDIDADKQFIINLCEMLLIDLSEYKNMGENVYNNSHHIMVILNGYFKIDLIYASSTDEFIKDMIDVDIGMLTYNLHTCEHMVAGKNFIMTIKKIFGIAKSKEMSCLYLIWNSDRTIKMTRIVKLMEHGFRFNKHTSVAIINAFVKSFYIPFSYEVDKFKCVVPFKNICMCTDRQYDKLFPKVCMNDKIYQFIKDAYKTYSEWGIVIENILIDRIIAYALCMKDYEFAKSQLARYHDQIGGETDKINLTCIPMLLRLSGNFDLTLYFLKFLSTNNHMNKFVFTSCHLPKQKIFQSFTSDAILSGNLEYYEKLVMYDSIFDIENMKRDVL